jgi:hypothetical protein
MPAKNEDLHGNAPDKADTRPSADLSLRTLNT